MTNIGTDNETHKSGVEKFRMVSSALFERAYKEKWLGALELWLRLGMTHSGIVRLDGILATEMGVTEKTMRGYLKKAISLDLIGTNGECYWIRSTLRVEQKYSAEGPRVKWWPSMPMREFVYAITVMVVMNFFTHLPALKKAGAIPEVGGVSHSIMCKKLAISKAGSSKLRRKCEATGLAWFHRRFIEEEYTNLDMARKYMADELRPGVTIRDGKIVREVTSRVEAGFIHNSIFVVNLWS